MLFWTVVEIIINRYLLGTSPVRYGQAKAWASLVAVDGAGLLRELSEAVEARWREVNGDSPRRASSQNWRFTLNPEIRYDNPSIEKRIAHLAVEGLLGRDQWANQIPVASGVLNSTADKKTAVDLSHRNDAGDFDLIELKMLTQSGHALFAAMEVILYGIAYLFARRNARELGYVWGETDLLAAHRVRLIVLAPAAYYGGVPSTGLRSLRSALNKGLAEECARGGTPGLLMEVDFEQFGEGFAWPCSDERLMQKLLSRHSVIDSVLRPNLLHRWPTPWPHPS
ncbi:MAG: hypothetical protein NTV52_26785 [Acidobacteria bacterium]|nr:hypothetical protein [Acidobacteriota bacterium]